MVVSLASRQEEQYETAGMVRFPSAPFKKTAKIQCFSGFFAFKIRNITDKTLWKNSRQDDILFVQEGKHWDCKIKNILRH